MVVNYQERYYGDATTAGEASEQEASCPYWRCFYLNNIRRLPSWGLWAPGCSDVRVEKKRGVVVTPRAASRVSNSLTIPGCANKIEVGAIYASPPRSWGYTVAPSSSRRAAAASSTAKAVRRSSATVTMAGRTARSFASIASAYS